MKSSIALLIVCLFSSFASAAETGQITMSAPRTESLSTEKSNLTEGGFNYTSLNEGSMFSTVAVIHEFDNGFALGARGFFPMQYTKQSQAYMGQAVARFILLNEIDQMFIEGTLAQGFFNGTKDGVPFVTLGSDYGYMHKFTDKLAAGGSLGLDYSNQRITQDTVTGQRTLYSKISLYGTYYF